MKRLAMVLISFLVLAVAPAQAALAGKSPVWWKISDGRSTVWVLGVPEAFSADLKWDDSALRQRILLADKVLYPENLRTPSQNLKFKPILGRDALDPLNSSNERPDIGYEQASTPTPFFKRFDPAFAARLNRQIASVRGLNTEKNLRLLDTASMALWLERTTWPDGPLVNPAVDLAVSLTPSDRLVTVTTTDTSLMDNPTVIISIMAGRRGYDLHRLPPPESVQQKCLADVLTFLEDPRTVLDRRAAMQAWADGNLDRALKRWSYVEYCLMGNQESTSAQNNWEKQVYYYRSAMDVAFNGDFPKVYVAIIPFDALTSSIGVLQYYKSIGYTVEVS